MWPTLTILLNPRPQLSTHSYGRRKYYLSQSLLAAQAFKHWDFGIRRPIVRYLFQYFFSSYLIFLNKKLRKFQAFSMIPDYRSLDALNPMSLHYTLYSHQISFNLFNGKFCLFACIYLFLLFFFF